VQWEGLPEPVQVVWREASLVVEVVALDPSAGDAAAQLRERFDPRRMRMDVRQAPLIRCLIASDHQADGERWLLLWLSHHLAVDHVTLEQMVVEARAHLQGDTAALTAPVPFRNFVAQARLGTSPQEHEAFFREMLGDVEEPTAPFGLMEALGDGSGIEEARMELASGLAEGLRERARGLGVSVASLCHVAWAQVLGRVSGKDDVVFGTVLLGRMESGAGAAGALGLFINTLPVRIRVGQGTVTEGVRETHALLARLLRHEHASLALAQRASGVAAPTPLFSALLNYRHSRRDHEQSMAGMLAWAGIEILSAEERTNYPLSLSVDDLGNGFALTARAIASIEPQRVCSFMETALRQLVDALGRAPETAMDAIDVLPENERRQVLEGWNATETGYPGDQCVHELFERQAAETPDATAVTLEERSLTYAGLNTLANRLAHHLRTLAVGPDVRVAICMERSLEMVVALFATLKAGGAYVPLDPGYPADRLAHMIQDAAPAVLLTHGAAVAALSGQSLTIPILNVDNMAAWQDQREDNPSVAGIRPAAANLAYIIYTSGSTGLPKGAMNQHGALRNRMLGMQQTHQLGPHDAVLQKTPFSFDVSVWEFFWPLISGARLVMAPPHAHKDPAHLARIIRQEHITTMHFVPSMLTAFVEREDSAGCGSLKRVFSGGEALSETLARRFMEELPRTAFYNMYGPAEAAIDVTAWNCRDGACAASVPIGRPLGNTQIYILDAAGRPAPLGVAGEIHIGGVQVGRGYLRRASRTAESFRPDPFDRHAGSRMYKTGDLGRWLPNGSVEYLGRNDFQVKIRGFRIELGEIEAALTSHPQVREAAVSAYEENGRGKQLVAYYTGEPVAAEALHAHLSNSLPDYMRPPSYVHLEALPLNPNGKLDRRALPAPGRDAHVHQGYEPPTGETEEELARIWGDVLRVERIGRHDNFFGLGGHSLLATMLIVRIKQRLGVEIGLASVFEFPDLASLAEKIVDAQLSAFDPAELQRLADLHGIS
jgi:amino acid adenylation domain-containing protein